MYWNYVNGSVEPWVLQQERPYLWYGTTFAALSAQVGPASQTERPFFALFTSDSTPNSTRGDQRNRGPQPPEGAGRRNPDRL
jgi:hypothetical protein